MSMKPAPSEWNWLRHLLFVIVNTLYSLSEKDPTNIFKLKLEKLFDLKYQENE